MDFDTYVAEINELAVKCGATDAGKAYCDAEAWRDSFDDGLTAEQAWSEEVYAASTMLS